MGHALPTAVLIIPGPLGLRSERILRLRTADLHFAPSARARIPGLDVARYHQCSERWPGSSDFPTLHIDLTPDEQAIFSNFRPGTRNEIRRCLLSDGLLFTVDRHPDAKAIAAFLERHRAFRADKGMSDSDGAYYANLLAHLATLDALAISSAATADGSILCSHTLLVAPFRVRLVNSASAFRHEDAQRQALIGRANRCLHWHDIRYFRAGGARIYDLGGISTDPVEPITRFKRSFGGTVVIEYHGFYRAFTTRGKIALWLHTMIASLRRLLPR